MPIKKDSEYKEKNSLRPNPKTADPSRGNQAFLQESILVGHFGDGWAASPTFVHGKAKTGQKPGGLGLDDSPMVPGCRSHLNG